MEDRVTVTDAADREQLWALIMLLSLLLVTTAWWALALWPAGTAAPAWLARTQAICFGTRENGMPDVTGWVGLIACPVGMLALLLASARRPLAALVVRARTQLRLQVLAAVTLLALSAASVAATTRISSAYRQDVEQLVTNEFGSSVRMNRRAPPLQLIDQHGSLRSLASVAGRPVILAFAYAHCETVCPTLVHSAVAAQNRLRESNHDVALMIVTLDPARDTPARLASIASRWGLGQGAYVLSGSPGAVQTTLDQWGVARTYNATNGDVTHASLAYVIAPNGRLIYEVSAPTSEQLVHLIEEL